MKRKSPKSDKMRICDIQPIEALTRQDRKNLFYIGIKFADPQLHGDFPKGDRTDEDVVLRIADKASRMIPELLVVVQPPQQGMRIEQQPHVPSSMDFRISAGRLSKSVMPTVEVFQPFIVRSCRSMPPRRREVRGKVFQGFPSMR